MSIIAAMEAMTDQRAVELGGQVQAAANALIEAKRRKAAADAAVTVALAEQTSAAAALATAEANMALLREAVAAELTPTP